MTEYALQLEHISKAFGQIQANRDISLAVRTGTIHGIVGENGAGKTTLMRIAYGFYRADEGRILVDDVPVQLTSPRVALAHGIGMVHQHSLLVGSMTAAENVLVGDSRPILAVPETSRRIRQLGAQTGLTLEPEQVVTDMSVANRQRLEIVKALYYGARILILDEPTAVLAPQEARVLFEHLRVFAAEGRTVIIITHKLPEVMDVTSRVTVLRGGRVAMEADTAETNEQALARAMVGRKVSLRLERAAVSDERRAGEPDARRPVLEVIGLSVDDDQGVMRLTNIDITVRSAEIVAIAAVEGNGQSELVEAVTGLRKPIAGRVLIGGTDITGATPRQRRERGMRHIAEDRLDVGLNLAGTIGENVIAGRHYRPPIGGRVLINLDATKDFAKRLIDRFAIVAPGPGARVSTLSGGNMQKVVIARELADDAPLIVAAQPTQGVDVGATEAIRTTLAQRRDAGAAILLVSSELAEIVDLADRVYVLFGGAIVGEASGAEINEEHLGLLMMGGRKAGASVARGQSDGSTNG